MSKITMSFFTDLHLRGQTPESRKDDYPQSILNKLEYCLKHASEGDFALFGGDFCHSHKLGSDSLKERCISLFDDYLKVPMFYTWGQHDLFGKEYDTRHDSTKAFILRQALRKEGKAILEIPTDKDMVVDCQGLKIGFIGCPSGLDPISWSKRICRRRDESIDIRIALVHHLLTDEEADWFIDIKTFDTGTVENRGFDIILCGDLHQGFTPYRNDAGTLFLNPGSLARTQKTHREVVRPIRGVDVIINTDDKSFEYKYWQVETAGSGEEVFKKDAPLVESVEQIRHEDKEEIEFDKVVEALESIGCSKIDIWDMLEKKAKEEGLDEETLNYILSKRPDA